MAIAGCIPNDRIPLGFEFQLSCRGSAPVLLENCCRMNAATKQYAVSTIALKTMPLGCRAGCWALSPGMCAMLSPAYAQTTAGEAAADAVLHSQTEDWRGTQHTATHHQAGSLS